jgi:hypothetical protein
LSYSESDWMNEFTFKEYLMWLRGNIPKYPGLRVLNCSAAQQTASVIRLAVWLKIEPDFIPPGLTDMPQPRDRSIFGGLKATA